MLSIQDKIQLGYWIRGWASLSEVESISNIGLVENIRFSERARDKFRFIWSWSAMRFEGKPGQAQDHFYNRHGIHALNRRIARVNRATARFLGVQS